MRGGVVCIFETHRKEEEVIDGERGFGLPGLRQTIVHLVSQSALQMWTHPSGTSRCRQTLNERVVTIACEDVHAAYFVQPSPEMTYARRLHRRTYVR